MTIQQYRDARREARRDADTLRRVVEEAYWTAQRSTHAADGLDDLESLEDGETRDNFTQIVISHLRDNARRYFRSQANLSNIRHGRMMDGYCGIKASKVTEVIEEFKGKMNKDVYDQFLQKRTRFGEKLQPDLNPGDYLRGQRDRVLAEVGLANDDRIDVGQIGVADMANLLDEFDENEVIRPVFLRNQKYFRA